MVRDEATGYIIGWKKKFRDDLLQKSYKAYANLYGESRDSVKVAFDVLEELGVIKRYFRDIVHSDGTESNNVMYIELNPNKIREITFGKDKKAEKEKEPKAAKKESESAKAYKRAAKNVASTASGTIGRELGNSLGANFGKFGKKLGGNVGASIGRNLMGIMFK